MRRIDKIHIWANVPAGTEVPNGFSTSAAPSDGFVWSLYEYYDADCNEHLYFKWVEQSHVLIAHRAILDWCVENS